MSGLTSLRAWVAARTVTQVYRRRLIVARLALNASAPLTAAALVMMGLSLAIGFVSMFAVARAAGEAARLVGSGSAPNQTAFLLSVGVVGGCFVLAQVLGPISSQVGALLKQRVDNRLRSRVLAATLEPTSISHLEDPRMADRIARAAGAAGGNTIGVEMPGNTPGYLIQQTSAQVTTTVNILIIGARFHPLLALGLLVGRALLIPPHRAHLKEMANTYMGNTEGHRRVGYLSYLPYLLAPAKEMRLFGLQNWVVDQFDSEWREVMTRIWSERGNNAKKLLVTILPLRMALATVAFVVLTLTVARGLVSVETYVLVAQAVWGVVTVSNWPMVLDFNIEWALGAMPALEELEAAAQTSVRARGTDVMSTIGAGPIRLEHLSFHYPGSSIDVLRDLDLTIPMGRSLAVVGRNGAGKTTLAKLLARLYEPSGGRITAGGQDISRIVPDDWQRSVAAIFQDFAHYPLSARDNIVFGAWEHRDDQAALEVACDRAGVTDIIRALPNGWKTILSREYTGGTDLSGGQWQRIALARALFAVQCGARILILDEPTAALDARAEVELFDRFLEVTAGVTTLVISHRFSTVRRADSIAVIDGGRVIESGNHQDLVALGGLYARMFALQSARFGAEEAEPASA